jgi:hypothetical protein
LSMFSITASQATKSEGKCGVSAASNAGHTIRHVDCASPASTELRFVWEKPMSMSMPSSKKDMMGTCRSWSR